jgi:hypothetical protein
LLARGTFIAFTGIVEFLSQEDYQISALHIHYLDEWTNLLREGAAEAVRVALLGADGPTGTFTRTGGVIPW